VTPQRVRRVSPITDIAGFVSASTMTPRTRNSNKDANFKVYYSKKVPQQVYFPHRRKTVRRPSGAGNDDSDRRQTRFLPEKMKIQRVTTIGDSEEEDEEDEDVEEGGVAIEPVLKHEDASRDEPVMTRGKKRHSDVVEADEDETHEQIGPTPKRRRKATASTSKRRSRQIKHESEDEHNTTPAPARQSADRSRTLRRQSTMTQLTEGRRPLSDTEEPDFKPVKRGTRLSWAGSSKKRKDKKQRTLTQMVPGMRPLEMESGDEADEALENVEAEERESQAYGEAIAARLAQGGQTRGNTDDAEGLQTEERAPHESAPQGRSVQEDEANAWNASLSVPSVVVNSVEQVEDDDDEESYKPTQFIEAPITRTRRTPRRVSGTTPARTQAKEAQSTTTRSTRKSRFSLLSTPEKRRIRVIPSSQSPGDSPLSTQTSPSKVQRSPLKERSDNNALVAETPSKRKQVTFQEPTKEQVPPLNLRKFESTIQDSEDEDEEFLETQPNESRSRIGVYTQAMIRGIDNAASGRIGTETQAILDQIDQVCAGPVNERDEDYPQELGESMRSRARQEPSPEFGEQFQNYTNENEDEEESQKLQSQYRTAYAGMKPGLFDDVEMLDLTTQPVLEPPMPPIVDSLPTSDNVELPIEPEQMPSSPPIIQPQVQDTCPSTPMVIVDSDDEDEEEPEPTPPRKSTPYAPQLSSTAIQQSADLDGDVQVPRSPPGQHDTQQSHSSKAEQQLHNEWSSYSQYVNARPPASSSMNVAHDKFSYHATPMPPRSFAPTQKSAYQTSQATTVDEVTPRKNRTQRIASANTTPREIASSQPVTSPSKPPPLFIPSSFPSPTKAPMDEWSSPLFGNTQMTYGPGGSLEDFSIPLPPPVEDDWMDG
jgi:hypothetical protein